MATLARTQVLEQKLEKHMREHADTMKSLRSELQILKMKPRAVKPEQRPRNDTVMAKLGSGENTRKRPTMPLKKVPVAGERGTSLSSKNNPVAGDKATNKMNVPIHAAANDGGSDGHITPHYAGSTLSSRNTCMSEAASVITKINYNGSIVSSPVNPIKLLEFLVLELQSKLKDYTTEGDEEIATSFNEINYAIRKVKLERQINRETVVHRMSQRKTLVSSSAIQTDIHGVELEKLADFQARQSSMQSEMDANMRRIEELFGLELKRSDDKIIKLSEDINSLQQKFSCRIDEKNTSMSHHIDLKTEEIKGEMKYLLRMIEETRNHSLIDNFNEKLAQTQKKIDEVRRKCTETARQCLQMHVGGHRSQRLASSKQLEDELGQIRALFSKDIHELRDVLMRTPHIAVKPESAPSLILHSSTHSSKSEEFSSSESIISQSFGINGKMLTTSVARNCCVDKFNSDSAAAVADDDDDDISSTKRITI